MMFPVRLARLASTVVALLAWGAVEGRGAAPAPGLERFYIGTYTGTSLGIYQASLNLGTGALGTSSLAASTANPSFVALDPTRRFLYCVNENAPGYVKAYAVNTTNGNLTFLNQQPSGGDGPCHVLVDRAGRNVFVANYNSGNASVFPIQTNGQLGTATAFVQDNGSSINASRQAGPHAHCMALDAGNHFAFLCDLGTDKIMSFAFDPVHGTLATNTTPFTTVTAGAGPRHFTFDATGQHGYVICELNSTITAYNYNALQGTLSAFQTVSTLPAANAGQTGAAEIVVHPSGKFLYASNRGYNSIAVFTIAPQTGSLTVTQQFAVSQTPRNFAIDPTGAWCLVAAQDGGNMTVYAVDPQTGLLTATGQSLSLNMPVCVLPFLIQPPQPVLNLAPVDASICQIGIGNSLGLLTYALYQSPVLGSGANWNLLATGIQGQTNFTVTNSLHQGYLRVGVSANY